MVCTTRSTAALVLLSLASPADIKLNRAESGVGIGSIDAGAVSGITAVSTIDGAWVLGRVEAKLSIYSALDALGVVCSDSAGLLGLRACFAAIAGVVAVAFVQVWVCNAACVCYIAVEEGAFDHEGRSES